MILDGKVPRGALENKWTNYRSTIPLVAPNNKRQMEIIIVGTGLAGASAAASLGELGYRVKCFTFHDSPRRAHAESAGTSRIRIGHGPARCSPRQRFSTPDSPEHR